VQALADFVYSGPHRAIMGRRREWFVPMREAFQVLWWVPEDALPSVADALERLAPTSRTRPAPFAFTFRSPFPAPGAASVRRDEGWFCPT